MKKHINLTLPALSVLFLLFLSLHQFFAPLSAHGQEEETTEASPAKIVPIETIKPLIHKKIQAINDKISAVKSLENSQAENRFGASLEDLKLRTLLLQETETIYQRQLAALVKQESLKKELILLEENSKHGTDKTITQKPPYSLDVYDYYLDQLSNASRQVNVASQTISVDKKSLGEAKDRLDEAEKKLRILSEADNKTEVSFEWQKLLAEDEKELAQSLIDLQQVNAANNEITLKLAEQRKNIDQQNIDWLKKNLTFNEEELANHLEGIEERRKELEQRIDRLLLEQHIAENKWLAATQQADPTQIPDENKLAIDTAYLQASEVWREAYQHVISHSNSMLQALPKEAQLWQRRYAFLKAPPSPVDLKDWRKEAKAEIEKLNRAMNLTQTHQNNVQAKIAAIRIQMAKENIDPEVSQHLEKSLKALNKLGERNFEYLTVLQGTNELYQRLIASINDHLQEFNISERLTIIWASVKSIWNYELFADETHAVTVGKIIITFLILIIGILFSGFFTRLIHRRLLVRLKMSISATAITEKLIYYAFIFIVTFIVLRSVNIPMTAFAFLGGAVAIGVGFGAQKLINNFISSFILMVEQPIKVGDLVQMETNLGKIEDIGVRCTRVLTFDNVHLLVPNSYFLENNITNWTHNNNMIRGRVTVGVAYGSSTNLVKDQLLKAVTEHDEILNNPEPYVLFDDFGDNSMIFTLFFWIMVERVIDKKRIESEIRFIIDDLFREAKLVIAFPQRDVHLDTNSPLQISIAKEDAEKIYKEETKDEIS